MLKLDDIDLGSTFWMQGTPTDLRADTWTPYVVVLIDIRPRVDSPARDIVIRYRQRDGDGRTFELYWYTFQRIARLKPGR